MTVMTVLYPVYTMKLTEALMKHSWSWPHREALVKPAW